MPMNIEIKAKAGDWEAQLAQSRAMSQREELLLQEDTFFKCGAGRLKLRDVGAGGESYLIFYQRADQAGPKSSMYDTSPVKDPASMKELLRRSLGADLTVTKKRTVFLSGQTRIHFDEVEGLGRFIEIEVCLKPGQSEREGLALAKEFMARLQIADSDLLEEAYIDMLTTARRAG